MEVKKQLRNSIVLPATRYALEIRAWNKSHQSRNSPVERSYMTRWTGESSQTLQQKKPVTYQPCPVSLQPGQQWNPYPGSTWRQ